MTAKADDRQCADRPSGRRSSRRVPGGGEEHQDTGGVGTALCVHVGVEDPGDEEADGGEQDHQRAYGAGPVGAMP